MLPTAWQEGWYFHVSDGGGHGPVPINSAFSIPSLPITSKLAGAARQSGLRCFGCSMGRCVDECQSVSVQFWRENKNLAFTTSSASIRTSVFHCPYKNSDTSSRHYTKAKMCVCVHLGACVHVHACVCVHLWGYKSDMKKTAHTTNTTTGSDSTAQQLGHEQALLLWNTLTWHIDKSWRSSSNSE